MITNYTKPQLIIKQILERLENAVGPALNAFVFGPQYELHRVTNDEEMAQKNGVSFVSPGDGNVQVVPFEELVEDNPIDEDYTYLYGKNLEARLVKYGQFGDGDAASNNGTLTPYIKTVGDNAEIIFKDDGNIAVMTAKAGDTLHASLHGRSVTPGDIVYIKHSDEVVKRSVISVERATTAPQETEVKNVSNNPDSKSQDANPTVTSAFAEDATAVFQPTDADKRLYLSKGSIYGTACGERFTITVTKAEDGDPALVSISSASGNFSAVGVEVVAGGNDSLLIEDAEMPGVILSVEDDINEGDGLRVGDIFSLTTEIAYTQLSNANFEFSGTYAYDVDNTLIIEVLTTADSGAYANTSIKITDSAGKMTAVSTTLVKDLSQDRSEWVVLGNSGLSIRLLNLTGLPQPGLRVGDFYTKELDIGKEDGVYGVVVVNGPVANTSGINDTGATFNTSLQLTVVDFRKVFTGFVPKMASTTTPQWFIDADLHTGSGTSNSTFGINVNNGVSINDVNRDSGYQWLPIVDEETKDSLLYAHWRALVKAKPDEQIHYINDVVTQNYGTSYAGFGKIDVDNPLGFGINCALSGSQGKGIYAARIEDNSGDSWGKVLEKAEKNSNIYAICPLSSDLAIQQMASSHVTAMSQEKVKRWRRAYVGTDSPDSFAVIGGQGALNRSLASIGQFDGTQFIKVRDEDGRFMDSLIKSGDLFRFQYQTSSTGVETYDEYEVDYVLSNQELVLKTGLSGLQPVALPYEIWKDDSADNLATYVATRSAAFGNRRLVNVWVDRPLFFINNAWTEIDNFYIAAEMAGLRSAVQPQQGLTHTEVRFVGSAPSMFTKFTESHLDDIAASGTWIVTQEYENGPRFIRHQLTTDTDNGNLYYEDSVGSNLDEVSYAINTRLLNYIGKRNANAATIIDIYNDVFGVLTDRTTAETGVTVGAALSAFDNLTVKIDDVFKDRVNVNVDLTLPLPLNTIVVTLNAIASFGDLSVTQTTTVLSSDGLDRLLDPSSLSYS